MLVTLVYHRQMFGQTYLIGTCDDARKLALGFSLAFDHSFDDAGMVRPQIDEAMGDASLPNGLEKGKGCSVHVGASGGVWARHESLRGLVDGSRRRRVLSISDRGS